MLLEQNCPPAWNGCTCACHRTPGMVHTMACCGPGINELAGRPLEHLIGSCTVCGFSNGKHDPECPNFFLIQAKRA